MILRQVTHDDLGCASYLIGDDDAGVAAVVDPRLDIDEYLRLARYLGVSIEHVLETHVWGLEHVLDRHAEIARESQVLMKMSSPRVHDGGDACVVVADGIRTRSRGRHQGDLSEDHRVLPTTPLGRAGRPTARVMSRVLARSCYKVKFHAMLARRRRQY